MDPLRPFPAWKILPFLLSSFLRLKKSLKLLGPIFLSLSLISFGFFGFLNYFYHWHEQRCRRMQNLSFYFWLLPDWRRMWKNSKNAITFCLFFSQFLLHFCVLIFRFCSGPFLLLAGYQEGVCPMYATNFNDRALNGYNYIFFYYPTAYIISLILLFSFDFFSNKIIALNNLNFSFSIN